MPDSSLSELFGPTVDVLNYVYDHRNEEILKTRIQNDVLSTYVQLMEILDTLESKELIKIKKVYKKHIVSITQKGIKVVEKLREVSSLL